VLGLIVGRYVAFTAVWILSGRSFWLFPNLLSDQERGPYA
jgi:hypothetical protein